MLARANLVRAKSLSDPSNGIEAKARMATGPLSGVLIFEIKVHEIKNVTENGVIEADTATNTGVPKGGDNESAERDTCVAADVVKGKVSIKATTEIRSSIEEEKACVRESLAKVGVDPAKILIGPLIGGVIVEDTVSTRKIAGLETGAKVLGGARSVEDV